MTTKIFLTGATGYIGGAVLNQLFEHPNFSKFNITALVRSAEKAEHLHKFGVQVVEGSITDDELVERLTPENNVIIAMADSDNLLFTQASLRGLKKRHEVTGKLPIYINNSGTGMLMDNAVGDRASDVIWDDLDADHIENSLPGTAFHRNVDLALIQADKEGYVRTYIIAPSTIYRLARGRLVDEGIQHAQSVQIPTMAKISLGRGLGSMIGEGKNIWPHVHIEDSELPTDLFIRILDASLKDAENIGHGREGIYFAENGEYIWYEVAKLISEALVALGIGKSTEPLALTDKELEAFPKFLVLFGTNSRCHANRARSIGWKPKYTHKMFISSISLSEEVEFTLKEHAAAATTAA